MHLLPCLHAAIVPWAGLGSIMHVMSCIQHKTLQSLTLPLHTRWCSSEMMNLNIKLQHQIIYFNAYYVLLGWLQYVMYTQLISNKGYLHEHCAIPLPCMQVRFHQRMHHHPHLELLDNRVVVCARKVSMAFLPMVDPLLSPHGSELDGIS
jgi:hypothetical protein